MTFDKIDRYIFLNGSILNFLEMRFGSPSPDNIKELERLEEDMGSNLDLEIENEMWENTGGNVAKTNEYKTILRFKLSKYPSVVSFAEDIIGEPFSKSQSWVCQIESYLKSKGINDEGDVLWKYTVLLNSVLTLSKVYEDNIRILSSDISSDIWDADDYSGVEKFNTTITAKQFQVLFDLLRRHRAISKDIDVSYFVQIIRTGRFGKLYNVSESKNKLIVAIKTICNSVIDTNRYQSVITDSIGVDWKKLSKRTVEDKNYINELKKMFPD